MFKLNNVQFEINHDESVFYIENHNGFSFALDINCKRSEYDGFDLAPSICINYFKTNAKSIEELNGMNFFVNSLEDSTIREDTLYLLEHEPFENYSLKIIEIKNKRVHILCSGVAVTDGYSTPYNCAPFELDTWIKYVGIST